MSHSMFVCRSDSRAASYRLPAETAVVDVRQDSGRQRSRENCNDERADFRFLRRPRPGHVECSNLPLLDKRSQFDRSHRGIRFVTAQRQYRFAKSPGQLECQSRAARQSFFDAEHDRGVAIAHVPFGALRIMTRRRFAQQILRRYWAVFRSPLPRTPTAVCQPVLNSKIECRAIGSGLPA
jgi:hypothetical protein